MENTIKKLYEATNKFRMFYAYAYNDGPSVGMRAADNIITNDIVWLVAADTYVNGEKLDSVGAFNAADIESMTVNARASAFIHGLYVTVELGTYSVVYKDNAKDPINDRGYLGIVRR